jgi:hypothetical protein
MEALSQKLGRSMGEQFDIVDAEGNLVLKSKLEVLLRAVYFLD